MLMMSNLVYPMKAYLSRQVPRECFDRLAWVSDDARSMGIHIMAGKGSGKSRLMGRIIGWLDFIRGIPQVIFDPHGPTIDNFLDKVIRMPPDIQRRLWSRVLYVDMSGKAGSVIPFPLFYRLGDESLYEISQRYLDVVRKIDPFLQSASIEGWNALWRVGTHCGILLAALGCQISEAEDIVINTQNWQNRFAKALSLYPEIYPSVNYLQKLAKEREGVRSRKIESYLNKISIFSLDDSIKAMFGSNKIGINWQEIVGGKTTVLLDFRHEHDVERRRFKMVWAFNYLMDFIKHRGAGRYQPVGLIIDELTSLFSLQALSSDLFGAEMDELINVLARNYRLWLTIAHQEMFQLTERIYKSLMTMGTQILGVTSDPVSAKYLADLFFKYRPYWVKKTEAVYGNLDGVPIQIDTRTVEFTNEEQVLMESYFFRDQKTFQFYLRPAPGEGNIRGELRRMTIENFDKGIFPHPSYVPLAREKLMKLNGERIDALLEEIYSRRQGKPQLNSPRIRNSKKDISIWD
ncbi:MAG: hypothetical protein ACTSPB_22980 [Candidatus Thorarchaeota archaeon]